MAVFKVIWMNQKAQYSQNLVWYSSGHYNECSPFCSETGWLILGLQWLFFECRRYFLPFDHQIIYQTEQVADMNIDPINKGPEILLKYRCISWGEEVCGASGSIKTTWTGFLTNNKMKDEVTVNFALEIVTSTILYWLTHHFSGLNSGNSSKIRHHCAVRISPGCGWLLLKPMQHLISYGADSKRSLVHQPNFFQLSSHTMNFSRSALRVKSWVAKWLLAS
jgi:hypothetical protein